MQDARETREYAGNTSQHVKGGIKFKTFRVPGKKDPQAGSAAKLKYLMALASLQEHPSTGAKTTYNRKTQVLTNPSDDNLQKNLNKNKLYADNGSGEAHEQQM